ncbi:MAG: hypothetical protein ABW168_11935 [Sedimenticola sp.]
MAKIIALGCQVADIHHRYSAIHNSLFGITSYRLAVAAMLGKTETTYREYEIVLDGLWNELDGMAEQVSHAATQERVSRGPDQLPQALVQYTHALHEAIAHLRNICHEHQKNKVGYRDIDTEGGSRFNQDKVAYDLAITKLEHLGTKLNKLFSSY